MRPPGGRREAAPLPSLAARDPQLRRCRRPDLRPGEPVRDDRGRRARRDERVVRARAAQPARRHRLHALRGDDIFIVYEDERWTFADFIAKVDELGAALVDRYGVAKGDRVAISMRNYPEWIVSWAAALSVGAIAVSLNAWWTVEEIDFALGDAEPKILIADVERVERAAAACAARGVALLGVRLGDGPVPGDDLVAVDRWEDVLVPGTTPPRVEIGPDDDATILFTSGTTGHPKGAVSTHRAVIHALMGYGARAALDRLRLDSDKAEARRGARAPGPTTPTRWRPRAAVAGVHPDRAAVPRHGLHPGDAELPGERAEAGRDAQVGPRAGARADRARAGHHLRGRAHPELRPAAVAAVRRVRHLEPLRGRRGWRARRPRRWCPR